MENKEFVEALHQKGTIKITPPELFLEEEVRCGYTVSREMKKVWLVMLDLLSEFDRVCKKHNLKYCVTAGTLLGAVRHKGFIPWDDDLDVQMPRHDYDKLMQIGENEFRHPYFFQTKYTDLGMPTFFAKLRNSMTTAFTSEETNGFIEYNKGIFMDIFPIDNLPNSDLERENYYRQIINAKNDLIREQRKIGIFSDCSRGFMFFIKKGLYNILSFKRKHPNEFLKKFEALSKACAAYSDKDTSQITASIYSQPNKVYYNAAEVEQFISMDFEFLKVQVPCGYDSILKVLYGDWKEIKVYPPHSSFFDVERSYIEY